MSQLRLRIDQQRTGAPRMIGLGQRRPAFQVIPQLGRADRPHAVVDAPRAEPPLRDLEAAPLAEQ